MTEQTFLDDYATPSPGGWLSFTHLASGHLVSTVWVSRDDIDMHGVPHGTSVRSPDGTWTEERRYDTEALARQDHDEVVGALMEERP